MLLDEVLRERYDLIEHQLAHTVRDPNGRAYNRTEHLEERRRMMSRWADYLDELRNKAKIAIDAEYLAQESVIPKQGKSKKDKAAS